MSTNTIFKSNKFSVEIKDNDYRYVHANKTIKKGELLLIEHCYLSKDASFIQTIILESPELFDNLYPRKEKWTEQLLKEEGQTEDIMTLLNEKAQKNMFGFDSRKDKYSVGLDISNFNHSINQNAYVKNKTYIIDENVSVFIMYIISNQEINIDEEITISYGNGYFGEDVCIHNNMHTTEADILVEKIMNQYMQKKKCIDMIIIHICMFYGLYMVKDDLICPTKRFMKTLNAEFSIQNLEKWIYEKEVYYKYLLSAF